MIKFAKIFILVAILSVFNAKNTYNRKNTVKCKTIEYPEEEITILSCKWCGLRQHEPTHIIDFFQKKGWKFMIFENVQEFF